MNEWNSVRMRSKLAQEVEQHIKKQKDHGIQRYDSIADFVRDAVIRLLDEEVRKEEVLAK